MNTVDDLRRTLERHTDLAPDGTGMIEQARRGAGRIRRRRRVVTTVATVVAVLLVALGVPLMARRDPPRPAAPAPARSASEMSIGLAADSGFTVQQRAATGARQLLVPHEQGTDGRTGAGEVWAYDPGAFDPGALPPGETVRVGGHDALLVPALTRDRLEFLKSIGGFPTGPRPSVTPDAVVNVDVEATVVWQDPSGIWVTVGRSDSRAALLRLAAVVRVGEPSPPLSPVGLSWLPYRLEVTHAETMEDFPVMYGRITLAVPEPGPNAAPVESAPTQGPSTTAVEIYVEPRTGNQWNDGRKLPAATLTIAGHPAWYSEGEAAGYSFGPNEGLLLIKTDTCGIRVVTEDFTKVTGAELKQMMNLAGYGRCTDLTGWTPVVP